MFGKVPYYTIQLSKKLTSAPGATYRPRLMFGFDFEHGGPSRVNQLGWGGEGLLTKFCRNQWLFCRIKQSSNNMIKSRSVQKRFKILSFYSKKFKVTFLNAVR